MLKTRSVSSQYDLYSLSDKKTHIYTVSMIHGLLAYNATKN